MGVGKPISSKIHHVVLNKSVYQMSSSLAIPAPPGEENLFLLLPHFFLFLLVARTSLAMLSGSADAGGRALLLLLLLLSGDPPPPLAASAAAFAAASRWSCLSISRSCILEENVQFQAKKGTKIMSFYLSVLVSSSLGDPLPQWSSMTPLVGLSPSVSV